MSILEKITPGFEEHDKIVLRGQRDYIRKINKPISLKTYKKAYNNLPLPLSPSPLRDEIIIRLVQDECNYIKIKNVPLLITYDEMIEIYKKSKDDIIGYIKNKQIIPYMINSKNINISKYYQRSSEGKKLKIVCQNYSYRCAYLERFSDNVINAIIENGYYKTDVYERIKQTDFEFLFNIFKLFKGIIKINNLIFFDHEVPKL